MLSEAGKAVRLPTIAMLSTVLAALGGCGDDESDDDAQSEYRLELDGMTLDPTPIYTACEEHTDCTLVSNECSCCGRAAVLGELRQTWNEQRELACEDYMGAICDCAPEDVVARCVEGRCAAVARSEVGTP